MPSLLLPATWSALYLSAVEASHSAYYEATADWRHIDAALAPYGLSLARLLLAALLWLALLLACKAFGRLKGAVSSAQAERDMLLLADAPRSDGHLPLRVDLAVFPCNYYLGACVECARAWPRPRVALRRPLPTVRARMSQ